MTTTKEQRKKWLAARELALQSKEKTYRGKPCLYGHDGERYAVSNSCVECRKQSNNSVTPKRKINRSPLDFARGVRTIGNPLRVNNSV